MTNVPFWGPTSPRCKQKIRKLPGSCSANSIAPETGCS